LQPALFCPGCEKELEKLEFPDHLPQTDAIPKVTFEDRDFKRMSLNDIETHDREYARILRDGVFSKGLDTAGFFVCAQTGFRSKSWGRFHVDHKVPLSKGGMTVPQNLQLLKASENFRKGNR
jgi:ATP-dependent helicase IRC3